MIEIKLSNNFHKLSLFFNWYMNSGTIGFNINDQLILLICIYTLILFFNSRLVSLTYVFRLPTIN